MKVAEIFAELGFNIKDENLGDFVNKLATLNLQTIAAAAGLGGVYLGLKNITEAAFEAGNALYSFNAITGMNTEELQKWVAVGEKAGIKASAVTSSFKGLQQAITAIQQGGGNVEPFIRLGIDINTLRTDADGMRSAMNEISEALVTQTPAMRRYYIGMLGMDEAMLQLFESGMATNKMLDDQRFMTDEGVKAMRAFGAATTGLGQEWKKAMQDIAVAIAPAIEGLAILLTKFMEFYNTSDAVRSVTLAIVAIGAALLIALNPLAVLFTTISGLAIILGIIVKEWDKITAAIDRAVEATARFVNSPMGKLLGGNLVGAAQSVFMPSNQTSNQNSQVNDNRQENHLTVQVNGGAGASGVIDSIEDAWEKLLARTGYQRKLKAT